MQNFFCLSLLTLAHGSEVTPVQKVVALQVTPVQKVVILLQGMLEKGKKEKHDEQEQFAEFAKFCEDVVHSKEVAIGEETSNIDHFTADIRKERATATWIKTEIARLDQDISSCHGDIKAATNVRRIEKADFEALHEDYSESVDALMSATATLRKQSGDRTQQSGLMQISTLQSLTLIPASAKKAIDAFVQMGDGLESLAMGAPEANAYEFQSAGVISMLEKLLDKFIDERRIIEKGEQNSQDAFEVLIKDLDDQIVTANQRRNAKAVSVSKQLEMKADNKGERSDEFSLKGADTKYKKDLQGQCKVKTLAFEARQKLRADEIIALEKAITIISGEVVAGKEAKHFPTMLQKNGTAFPQLRSSSKSWNPVAVYLQDQAAKLNNRMLAEIAEHAAKDPFTKVKKMLNDLLLRLVEQAADEMSHKGWCDTELAANGQTRKEKTNSVEALHAEIDQLQAGIAKLTEDISELTMTVAELDAAMAERTKLRNEERATNAETVDDATKAQTAVDQAMLVLTQFYVNAGEAAEATSFVQKSAAPPEMPDSEYTGMGGESGKVLGMLEVILADFARLEASTKAAEASSQAEYDLFMTDSKNDKAAKSGDIEHKSAKKQDKSELLTNKNGDLDGTSKELDAAMTYFYKLKSSCVDSGVSFEDRVAQRNEEVRCLREALRILSGAEIP